MNTATLNFPALDPEGSLSGAASLPLAFIDGACDDQALLRQHILAPIKDVLTPQIVWQDAGRKDDIAPGTVRVSLFPNVPGDVLLMFDLADRNHFRQFASDGRPFARDFRKILVPGNWLRRQLLADTKLKLRDDQVIAAGAPRVDYLRNLMAAQPPRTPDAPLNVLFAPVHDNWFDRKGQAMSMSAAMAPYLEVLKARVTVTEAVDGRNKDYKRPITAELLAADIVITDYTSVMYEAWALGKPVLFLRWLTGDRIIDKAPHCAEAHIYRQRIGHHLDRFEDMITLLARGRDLDLGPGVEAFMADYLENWQGKTAASTIARILERLANPELEMREREARQELEIATKAKDWTAAEPLLNDLLVMHPAEARLYDLLAQAMKAQGKWWQELDALEQCLALSKGNPALFIRLGDARARMGRCRAAAEAYSRAIELAPKKATADLHYKLGFAHESPGHDGPPDLRRAAEAYKLACAHDPANAAARFGVGALHAQNGRWKEAQGAYQARLATDPLNAELHQRLGMAHDRCYDWPEAEAAYLRALALDSSKAAWHYRLGFVLERQEKFDDAAAAYLHAATLSKTHQPDWFYRAGYTLEKAGRLEEACKAFFAVQPKTVLPAPADPYQDRLRAEHISLIRSLLDQNPNDPALLITYSKLLETQGELKKAAKAAAEAVVRTPTPNDAYIKRQAALDARLRSISVIEARLKHDCTHAEDWLRYSTVLENTGRSSEAIAAMEQAVLRSNEHQPAWHHRLGHLLMQAGRPDQACAAFRDQKILQRPHGIYEDKFATQAALNETATYREFHDLLPIREKTILYEAFGGVSLACNPLAIFKKTLNDPRFDGWLHVWSLESMKSIPEEYQSMRNVVFVQRDSMLFKRYLATAQYLIHNSTYPYYFVRRDGQEYLNTWHGTPLKSLGYDIKDNPFQRANTARNMLQTSLIISPNAHTEYVVVDRYGIRDLYTGSSMITGYPRIDMMLNATDADKAALRKKLGIAPEKKVVLYAPTYRGIWNSPQIEAEALVKDIERLQDKGYTLLFRGHYFAEKFLLEMGIPVIIAKHEIDSCTLMSIVDVLITDYSSIFFDFLPSRKPIIHYVPDWDDYAANRGVYFERNELPGHVCDNIDALKSAVDQAMDTPESFITDNYLAGLERFGSLEDGKSTDRVINAFFFDNRINIASSGDKKGKPKLLFHCGTMEKNGITSSASALLQALKKVGFSNTLLVDRRVIVSDDARVTRSESFQDRAAVLVRSGASCYTPEEKWLNDKFNGLNDMPNKIMENAFLNMISFEVRRIFGPVKFDVAVDFYGYRQFPSQIISSTNSRHKSILLHNEMLGEYISKFPYLHRAFQTYRHFDSLISVSESVNLANKKYITENYDLPKNRFYAATNLIDIDRMESADTSDELDADLKDFQNIGHYKLISVARVSPEKNHHRAIDAVDLLVKRGVDVSLYIVGEGPLQRSVQSYITAKKLNDHVCMVGLKENPYGFIRAADCLVLSSDHEGQGIVLLEAMTLGTPCVATNIPGPQSVLEGGLGLLTDLTPEALADGIEQVLTGAFVPKPFDAEAYNAKALNEFLRAVGLPEVGTSGKPA